MTDSTTITFPWPVHPAAELFPLLGDTELTELADDVRTRGLLEPVWLYDDPERGTVLLDGRNRALACRQVGIDIGSRTYTYTGSDPVGFSIAQNLKRRHLSVGQKAAIGYKAMPLYEAEARQRVAEAAIRERAADGEAARHAAEEVDHQRWADLPTSGDPQAEPEQPPHPTPEPQPPEPEYAPEPKPAKPKAKRARDQAATATGVSGRAMAQYKRIVEEAPDLAAKVDGGELALDRAERIIRDREAEARRIAEAKRDAEAAEESTTVDIRHGDFRDVLADVTGIDAIITDPPYPHEFIPLLEDLAKWADQVLTPDGVLCVLIGQTYLPEVYRLLEGHRPYRWTGCYLTGGPGYVSWQRKVQSNWKPLLVYGGGPRFGDVIRSEGTDANAKALHKWGQDYSAFHTIVDRFTARGQTVADPFMGAGTTLLAARALGRHAVGCDIDAEHVSTARERLT